jgi:hypothetical protein
MSIESLENDIELAKGIGQLADATNKAITILARAILELADEAPWMALETREAIERLAEEQQ